MVTRNSKQRQPAAAFITNTNATPETLHEWLTRSKGVGRNKRPSRLIHLMDSVDYGLGSVIEIENGGVRVQTRGMETVTVLHRDLGKLLKVLGEDGSL